MTKYAEILRNIQLRAAKNIQAYMDYEAECSRLQNDSLALGLPKEKIDAHFFKDLPDSESYSVARQTYKIIELFLTLQVKPMSGLKARSDSSITLDALLLSLRYVLQEGFNSGFVTLDELSLKDVISKITPDLNQANEDMKCALKTISETENGVFVSSTIFYN